KPLAKSAKNAKRGECREPRCALCVHRDRLSEAKPHVGNFVALPKSSHAHTPAYLDERPVVAQRRARQSDPEMLRPHSRDPTALVRQVLLEMVNPEVLVTLALRGPQH